MFRFARWLMALVTLSLLPIAAYAQQAVNDSGPHLTPPAVAVGGFVGLLITYHLFIATGISSGISYLLGKYATWFVDLGNFGKAAVTAISAFLTIEIIKLAGGAAPTDLSDMLASAGEAIASAVVSGQIFRFGKTQPSTVTEQKAAALK